MVVNGLWIKTNWTTCCEDSNGDRQCEDGEKKVDCITKQCWGTNIKSYCCNNDTARTITDDGSSTTDDTPSTAEDTSSTAEDTSISVLSTTDGDDGDSGDCTEETEKENCRGGLCIEKICYAEETLYAPWINNFNYSKTLPFRFEPTIGSKEIICGITDYSFIFDVEDLSDESLDLINSVPDFEKLDLKFRSDGVLINTDKTEDQLDTVGDNEIENENELIGAGGNVGPFTITNAKAASLCNFGIEDFDATGFVDLFPFTDREVDIKIRCKEQYHSDFNKKNGCSDELDLTTPVFTTSDDIVNQILDYNPPIFIAYEELSSPVLSETLIKREEIRTSVTPTYRKKVLEAPEEQQKQTPLQRFINYMKTPIE
ncbi:MAG: hypothetical protein Q8Q35_00740 [Nanoarchaeota archaeon]|nr:hypothetical protein [Nanoarchaeota archaeon]